MSALEELANSRADHRLVPLGAGRGYAPVLSGATGTATMTTTFTAVIATAADCFVTGGTTAFANDADHMPSARIPARGSAKELLDLRSSSIG